jgi:hypothetical protein
MSFERAYPFAHEVNRESPSTSPREVGQAVPRYAIPTDASRPARGHNET